MREKKCDVCKQTKSIEDFAKAKSGMNEYNRYCIECDRWYYMREVRNALMN